MDKIKEVCTITESTIDLVRVDLMGMYSVLPNFAQRLMLLSSVRKMRKRK